MFSQACVKNSVHRGTCIPACTETDTPLPSACWDTPPKQTTPGESPPWADTPFPPTAIAAFLLEYILVRYFIDEESKLSLNVRNSTRLEILQVLTSAAMFPSETMHIMCSYPDSISKVYMSQEVYADLTWVYMRI